MNLMYDMYFVLFEKFEKVFRYSADLERGRGGGEIRSIVRDTDTTHCRGLPLDRALRVIVPLC